MSKSFLTFVFSLLAIVASSSATLVGKYKNELGSTMDIARSDGSTFSGTYHTAVSSNGSSLDAPLTGVYNPATRTEGTISFSVNWKFESDGKPTISTTSWNGIARSDGSFHTTWLITGYCAPADEWAATTVGKDLFVKIQ